MNWWSRLWAGEKTGGVLPRLYPPDKREARIVKHMGRFFIETTANAERYGWLRWGQTGGKGYKSFPTLEAAKRFYWDSVLPPEYYPLDILPAAEPPEPPNIVFRGGEEPK